MRTCVRSCVHVDESEEKRHLFVCLFVCFFFFLRCSTEITLALLFPSSLLIFVMLYNARAKQRMKQKKKKRETKSNVRNSKKKKKRKKLNVWYWIVWLAPECEAKNKLKNTITSFLFSLCPFSSPKSVLSFFFFFLIVSEPWKKKRGKTKDLGRYRRKKKKKEKHFLTKKGSSSSSSSFFFSFFFFFPTTMHDRIKEGKKTLASKWRPKLETQNNKVEKRNKTKQKKKD